ncbi:MAG TPA: GntR family transcriptional regulator [Gemmataceae bacterium]|jgi:DNA-binding GntR family transcriptional regulator|nr:GntR family transcriptional regulator [Gemmataceae bacterium]
MPITSAARLKAPKRRPLGQTIAESLRDAIYTGRFRPGQRVAQAVIARELGVSQTTVRDALATLEREGLVQRTANQGALVTSLSRNDVEEIISLRTALEAMAIRQVIRDATPEQLEQLDENIQAMTGSWGAGQVAELDLQFHELLVGFANHARLLSCWHTLLSQLKLLLVHHNLRDPRSLQKTVQNHRELLRLIKARDECRAVAHLERSGAVYRLEVLGDSGSMP